MINKIRIILQRGMVICRLTMVFVSAVFFLFSCESNSAPETDRGESVPLTVNELSLTGEVVSRVTEGVVNTDGAAISVSQLAFNGYMPAYNCAYTYSSADGGWNSATPICVDDREAKIMGVYDPHGVAFPASNASVVPSTNLTAQLYDDTKVWYFDNSHTAVKNTNAAIAFKMKPAYSRMTLEIERDASCLSDCKITEVTLSSGGAFYNDLPLDMSTGTLQGGATAYNADTKPLLTKADGFVTIPSGSTSAQSIDLLLPPQTIQNTGLVLSIKVDGQVRSVTIPYASLPKLESAMQYKVPLKIIGPATLTVNGTFTGQAWNATPTAVGTVTDISGM